MKWKKWSESGVYIGWVYAPAAFLLAFVGFVFGVGWGLVVPARDGHRLVLEENWIELNQTVFKI
jgi:hypothetical protein